MDRNRTVAGLDVHKDSIYLCIMGHDGSIIFEKTYGVLTPELRQMLKDMVERGVTEAAMESTAVYWVPVWKSSVIQISIIKSLLPSCSGGPYYRSIIRPTKASSHTRSAKRFPS